MLVSVYSEDQEMSDVTPVPDYFNFFNLFSVVWLLPEVGYCKVFEEDQSPAFQKCAFRDSDSKLVIKK